MAKTKVSLKFKKSKKLPAGRKKMRAGQQELKGAKKGVLSGNAKRVRELEREVLYLEEKSRSKDEFIRITNHELRTPLDVIRGNLDMVLKGDTGPLGGNTKEYLQDALHGADRMAKLVNAILEFSRIESGRQRFTLTEVNLGDFFQHIIEEFKQMAKMKKIELRLESAPNLPHVYSDHEKLYEIFDNLLVNAVKFTPPAGSVTVRVIPEKETVLMSVKDTGIGIRPEDIGKIFKKFPEISNSSVAHTSGIGIGLFIVWQLLDKLGGEIWVESDGLGAGTTFFVRIPVAGTDRAKALERYHKIFLESEKDL